MQHSIKILDSPSGESDIFYSQDRLMSYKLIIIGTANSNIKSFLSEGVNRLNGFLIKVSCIDWNNVTVNLMCKSNNVDDDFTETGDSFIKDDLKIFYYT